MRRHLALAAFLALLRFTMPLHLVAATKFNLTMPLHLVAATKFNLTAVSDQR